MPKRTPAPAKNGKPDKDAPLSFDEIMRRALTIKPEKPKKPKAGK